ncbi:MAG: hypothetical protein OEX22_00330 [Cyclobacteriaceae bacterium]|nr:hypothetical protein [Cyclobacteriaceae bacterium]
MRTRIVNIFSLILLCLLVSSQLYGQKYKDIYPSIALASDEESMPILKKFLKDEPDHPNSNLLLALIYERRYKGADVLTEFEKAVANADRAKLRFTKSRVLVNDKEVKKNQGYYSVFSTGIDSKGRTIVDYETVHSALVNKYDSVNTYLEKVPGIYNTFVKAVNTYDKSIKTFYKINSKYNSLDDLYLLYDDELKNDLFFLKQSFDSTTYYLDEYKQKIKDYPIKGYNQDYVIKDIDTYRLSGLITQSDFLINTIELWNYGKWVDEVNSLFSADINSLRKGIINYEKTLNDGLKEASNPDKFSNFQPIKPNKELLFNLKKFDNNSLLAGIFQYKHSLQSVVHRSHNIKYYDTATNVLPHGEYTYYGEMINSYYRLDSVLEVVKSKQNTHSVMKHNEFMETYYKGYRGVDAYLNQEKKYIYNGFRKYVKTLRNAIIDDIEQDSVKNIEELIYNRKKIPMLVTTSYLIDSLEQGAFTTTHLLENTDNSKYLAGIYKSTTGTHNTIVYAVRISPENKVSWYKEYTIEIDSADVNTDNIVVGVRPTQAGCAFVVRSIHKTNKAVLNSLIYLDEEGNEDLVKRLEVTDYPRTINYNEKTNSFVISFRDNDAIQDFKNEKETVLLNINVFGDLLWSYKYSFSGTLENVVNTNKGYLLAGNFTSKKDENGNVQRTKVSENYTNIYLDFVSSRGKLSNTRVIQSESSIYLANVTKVNDSNISLIGIKDVLNPLGEGKELSYDLDLAYVFTNAKLQLIYTSL